MPDRPVVRTAESDVLYSEILWLASFGWSNHSIARQLHTSISCVEKYLTGKEPGPHTRSKG